MQLALDLAENGIGSVEPNPAVGCVIVKSDQIIGSGHHEQFGGPHAEINALTGCKTKHNDPTDATMYVTLEPCCHTGKTPPCSQAVIAAKIAKVIIAAPDPTDHVAGGGIKQLQQAGIQVEIGPCKKQALILNAPFYKQAQTNKPWVIAKWAQSADHFLASKTNRWISNQSSRNDVHQLRRRCQAILVGVDTVIADDPELTVRIPDLDWNRQPLRIILDTNLRIPTDRIILNTFDAQTLIVTTPQTLQTQSEKINFLATRGVQILTVPKTNDTCDLTTLLDELGKRDIQQLLVEGGPKVLTSFINTGLIDELRVYISPIELTSDGAAPATDPMNNIIKSTELYNKQQRDFNSDKCITGFLNKIS